VKRDNVDFKVLSMRDFQGWNILFSKMLQACKLLLLSIGLLGQRKFTVCWSYRIF